MSSRMRNVEPNRNCLVKLSQIENVMLNRVKSQMWSRIEPKMSRRIKNVESNWAESKMWSQIEPNRKLLNWIKPNRKCRNESSQIKNVKLNRAKSSVKPNRMSSRIEMSSGIKQNRKCCAESKKCGAELSIVYSIWIENVKSHQSESKLSSLIEPNRKCWVKSTRIEDVKPNRKCRVELSQIKNV